MRSVESGKRLLNATSKLAKQSAASQSGSPPSSRAYVRGRENVSRPKPGSWYKRRRPRMPQRPKLLQPEKPLKRRRKLTPSR